MEKINNGWRRFIIIMGYLHVIGIAANILLYFQGS